MHGYRVWPALALLSLASAAAGSSSYQLTDITYGLGTDRISAVAVHPRDSDTALVGVDGRVFKTDDGGESWRVVLSFHFGLAGDVGGSSAAREELAEEAIEELIQETATEGGDETVDRDDLDEDEIAEEYDSDEVDTDELPLAELPLAETVLDQPLPEGSLVREERPVFARTLPGVRALRLTQIDPDVVYVATPMGLYRSVDRGETFEAVPLPRRRGARDVRDVAVHPKVPTQLVVATRGGTFESLDGGYTWGQVPGRPGRGASLSVAIADNATSTLLVGTEEGLYRSDDGGRTFLMQLLAEGGRDQPVSAIAFDPHRQAIYVGTGRGLYQAGLGESIFVPVDLGQRDQIERIAVSPLAKGPVVVAGARGLYQVDFKRNQIDNLLAEGDVHGATDVSLDHRKAQVMWVATGRGLFRRIKGRGAGGIRLERRRLEEVVQAEPTLDEVVRAALAYARLDSNHGLAMQQRAAIAGALPELNVEARHLRMRDEGIGWGLGGVQGLEVLDELADFYGDIYDVEPSYLQGHEVTLVVGTLSWDLDELVSNSQATRISREERRNADLRGKLISRVVKSYTSRRRSLSRVVVRRSRESRVEVRRVLKLLEYTAQLDAQTGGWFSQQARLRGAEAIIGVSYDGSPLPGAQAANIKTPSSG